MNDVDGHIDSDLLTHDLLNDTHSPVEQSLLPGIYDCPFLNAVRAGIYDNPPLGQRLLPELYDCPFLNAIRAGIYDNPFQVDQSFPTSGLPSLQHEAFSTPVENEFEAADIGSPFGSQVRPGDFSKLGPGYYANHDRACDPRSSLLINVKNHCCYNPNIPKFNWAQWTRRLSQSSREQITTRVPAIGATNAVDPSTDRIIMRDIQAVVRAPSGPPSLF